MSEGAGKTDHESVEKGAVTTWRRNSSFLRFQRACSELEKEAPRFKRRAEDGAGVPPQRLQLDSIQTFATWRRSP